ncbi:VOC family protein [Ideonella sp. BN130291]|uniref:VOC family protein n=1 Tax=Ideonella sp. BN130291 TaxID=3112940 RepID=UPI002E263E06|nr:VOC family protein [Ideonella sp. BN130291]
MPRQAGSCRSCRTLGSMATPGALHHVEVYVASLQESCAFWEPFLAHFGYEVERFSNGVSMILGETYIVLVQAEEPHLSLGFHRKRVGLNHLAFHAQSREQVDQIAEWVQSNGYTLLYKERHPHAGGPNYYAMFCEDPNRIKVEVVAPYGT